MLLLALLGARAWAAPLPLVNEILADPSPGWGDASCDGVVGIGDLFVEIVNAGDAAADLSLWTLSDDTGQRHVFPAGTVIASGEGLVVFDSGVPMAAAPWAWCAGPEATVATSGGLGLDPAGDSVILASDSGEVVDAVSWGAEGGLRRSLVRDPEMDPAGALTPHDCAVGATGPFSPGTRPDGAPFGDPPAEPDPGCVPVDTDADGLEDDIELGIGTNPVIADTDGDSITDGREVEFGIDPLDHDSDDDGLSDSDEGRAQTNPNDADTDSDGLSDGDEVRTHQTDPKAADSDADGLGDLAEIFEYGTNPVMPDSDADGLADGDEITRLTDPTAADTDLGGVNDGQEVTNGTDPLDGADDLLGTPPDPVEPDLHLDEEVELRGQLCGCSASAADPRALGAIALLLGLATRRARRR